MNTNTTNDCVVETLTSFDGGNQKTETACETLADKLETSSIIIPEELREDIIKLGTLENADEELDDMRNAIVAKLLLANAVELSSGTYWDGFDLENATTDEMHSYMLSKADFDKEHVPERDRHYLIYVLRNKLNGKLYVGQHETSNVFDNYMGGGTVLALSKNFHGEDAFEKTILHDFDTWEECNQMESDIVTDVFWRKYDCVYNRHQGGFDGPNSSFQKEMYRLGIWKAYNEGRSLYHNAEGDRIWVKDGEEPPKGYVKGYFKNEAYKKLHDELDSITDELHKLGSTYTWRVGDSIWTMKRILEQRKKFIAEEERRKAEWWLVFDYLKGHTKYETELKFANVENICDIHNMISKFFPEEFEQYRKDKENEENEKERKRLEMIDEMLSFGLVRPFEGASFLSVLRMYEVYKRKVAEINEKAAALDKIFDEVEEHGFQFVAKKYNDKNIRQKFARYIPIRYKNYVIEKYGKAPDVVEDIYAKLKRNLTQPTKRKPKTYSAEYLEKKKQRQEELVRLFNELWALGSKAKFDENAALSTLRYWIASRKATNEKERIRGELYEKMHEEFEKNGFRSMCEKFNYTGARGNLIRRFQKCVKYFDKTKLFGKR